MQGLGQSQRGHRPSPSCPPTSTHTCMSTAWHWRKQLGPDARGLEQCEVGSTHLHEGMGLGVAALGLSIIQEGTGQGLVVVPRQAQDTERAQQPGQRPSPGFTTPWPQHLGQRAGVMSMAPPVCVPHPVNPAPPPLSDLSIKPLVSPSPLPHPLLPGLASPCAATGSGSCLGGETELGSASAPSFGLEDLDSS